jgi:hypothetical protein
MLSCDYNGWNDVSEDEREALEAYEAAAEASLAARLRVRRPAAQYIGRGRAPKPRALS